MAFVRIAVEIVSALILILQDFTYKRVTLCWALVFIGAIWPSHVDITINVGLGCIFLGIGYGLYAISGVDVVACICLMVENSLWSWSVMASASLVLVVYYVIFQTSLPLLGGLALAWLLLLPLKI